MIAPLLAASQNKSLMGGIFHPLPFTTSSIINLEPCAIEVPSPGVELTQSPLFSADISQTDLQDKLPAIWVPCW